MKTRSIARGFVGSVAALLGVMAAGCSAETGEPEAAEIGSTAQALTAAPFAHDFGSACLLNGTVKDQNNVDRAGDKVLVISGYSAGASPTFNRRWDLYDVTQDAWIATGTYGTVNVDERAFASTIPLSSSSCLLAGGGNTVSTPNTFKFEINATTKAIQVSSAGALSGDHSKGALVKCGTSKAMIAGGTDDPDNASVFDSSIEVWDGSTTWTTQTAVLSQGRYALAMAAVKDATADSKFVAAGGVKTGPVRTGVVDILSVTSGCANAGNSAAIVTANRALQASPSMLNFDISARDGLVAFKTSTNSQIQFAGGDEASALSSTAPLLTVDFSTHRITANSNTASPPSTAYPTLVDDGSGNVMLVGGVDHSLAAITNLTKYTGTFATPTTTALSTARVGAPSIYSSAVSRVFTAAGTDKLDGQSSASDLSSVESLQY